MAFIGKIIMGIVSIAEGSVVLVELAIKLIFWIAKLLSIAPKLLNPTYIINEGITGITMSLNVLWQSLLEILKKPFNSNKYDKCKDNGSGLFGMQKNKDDNGKIIGTNGKKCVPPTLFRLIIMILCPPLGLFLHLGLKGWLHVLIATFLTLFCFYFPGLLYVVLHVLC